MLFIDKNLIKADYLSGMKLKDIVEKHGLSMNTLKSWVKRYKWTDEKKKGAPIKKKRGAPLNNQNAVGNDGGAPTRNKNAEKHGFYSKWLPQETQDIINGMQYKTPLDLLWEQIEIQYAAIIRSQKIMYVHDKDDKTIERIEEKNGDSAYAESWEIQQAWDKQANFLKAQSRAIAELRNMIKDYLELEGADKKDAKENAQDWKAAIIEIAKKRAADKDG